MLDSLKQAGKTIGQEMGRAWESLHDGWREMLSRSGAALTHFVRGKEEPAGESGVAAAFPRWSLLAGEVEETAREIVVRMEIPGVEKDDCHVTIEGNVLRLSGQRRFAGDSVNSIYHVMERAYGAFERSVALPRNVDIEHAKASYLNGVLTVRLPLKDEPAGKTIRVA
jgi:HSP20 family protein